MKKEIIFKIGKFIRLYGILAIPPGSNTLVIFSHGSGSSRFSPRNNFVAEVLNRKKIATLMTDLLTEEEDNVFENRFAIDLLTDRLAEVTDQVTQLPELANFSIGYFGASTGAASALKAASRLTEIIKAVVSRGGRPDLAMSSLKSVKAPTLLIVGGNDWDVTELNRQAFELLHCVKKMKLVEGASHLFEEPGTLEEVAELACSWFEKHLHQSRSAMYID